MMCYKDRTYCASPNCKNECGRQLTDEDRQKALKWWASPKNPTGEGFPLAVSHFCDNEGKEVES